MWACNFGSKECFLVLVICVFVNGLNNWIIEKYIPRGLIVHFSVIAYSFFETSLDKYHRHRDYSVLINSYILKSAELEIF
jgi:hypothetical protein